MEEVPDGLRGRSCRFPSCMLSYILGPSGVIGYLGAIWRWERVTWRLSLNGREPRPTSATESWKRENRTRWTCSMCLDTGVNRGFVMMDVLFHLGTRRIEKKMIDVVMEVLRTMAR